MSEDKFPAKTPKVTREQAEAYKKGTPAARRATRIVLLVIWIVVVGTVLVLALVFHKTGHGGVPY